MYNNMYFLLGAPRAKVLSQIFRRVLEFCRKNECQYHHEAIHLRPC